MAQARNVIADLSCVAAFAAAGRHACPEFRGPDLAGKKTTSTKTTTKTV